MANPLALVSDRDPRSQFTADGIQREFVSDWPIRSTDELRIIYGEDDEPEQTYTIVGANDDGGFTISFDFPPPLGTLITVWREGAIEHSENYGQETEFNAATVNGRDVDIVLRLQEQRSSSWRSVIRAAADTATSQLRMPVPSAGQIIAWNAAGDALENVPFPGLEEEEPNNDTAVYPADLELTTAIGSDNGPTINARLALMSAAGGGELVGDGNAYPCTTGIVVPSFVTVRRLKVQLGPTATFAIAGRKRSAYSGVRLVSDAAAAATTMVWDTAPVGGGTISSLAHVGSPFSINDGVNQESGTITAIDDGTRTVTISSGGTGGGLQYAYTVAGASISIEACARISTNTVLLSDQVTVEAADITLLAVGDWIQVEDDRRTGGATTYQEQAQIVGIETVGANIISLSRQLRRAYLAASNARLTILDPARNAAVVGCAVECIGTAEADRFDSLFEIRYALDSIMSDCIYPGTDTVGRRGNMFRIHKSYGCHMIRPVGRNALFTDEGEGNGAIIAYSTRCTLEQPTFQAVRHGVQMIAATECECDGPDISDTLLTALDFHGFNSVGCYYTNIRNIAFASRTASASNGVLSIGNSTWLDGDHECGLLGGTVGPFQGNSGVYVCRIFPPSTRPIIKGVHATTIQEFLIHRDIPSFGTLKVVGGGVYDCSVDYSFDRIFDLQGKASGASVDTLEDFTISDFHGANLFRGILAFDVNGLKIRNSELKFNGPDASERYALNFERVTNLRVVNTETGSADRGIRIEDCPDARFITTHILDLDDTEWLHDGGNNDGTEFRGCNAYQVDGDAVVVGGSGSTITYKAVSNIGTETTAVYEFAATDKFLGRASVGAGAGEELPMTAAGRSLAAAATAIAQNDLIHAAGANIASASTTNIAAATGWALTITGTTTITAFGTAAAGAVRVLTFADILQITHNGTTLILPDATSITTAVGDTAMFVSLGSGNWKCAAYFRATGSFAVMPSSNVAISGGSIAGITDLAIADGGTAASTAVAAHDNLSTKSTDIASATTTDLATATGIFADVTGTTTITGLGTLTAGRLRIVRFTGILTLTHNGTSLILPGAENITTANGDVAIFVSLGSGNWKCVAYTKVGAAGTLATTGESRNLAATLNLQTGTTYTVDVSGAGSDNGRFVDLANAAAIAVTLPATAAVGFYFSWRQGGAGQVTFAAAGSGTLVHRQSHTKSAGQYGAGGLIVIENAGGSAAQWTLSGDTAT